MNPHHLINRAFPCRAAVLALGLSGFIGASGAWAETPRALVFAPLLLESHPDEIKGYLGPAELIENQLGRSVLIEGIDRYETLLNRFREGQIDIAVLGPLPYIALRGQSAEALPIVRFLEQDGRPSYSCALIAFADDVRPLGDYAGARLALTQPLSTCGYVSAAWLLKGAGLDIEQTAHEYLGRHDKVATAVVTGDYALGSVRENVAHRFASLGVRVIARTEPVPGFALVVNRASLSDEEIARLTEAFTRLAPRQRAEDAAATAHWNTLIRHGAIAAQDADYDALRAKIAQIGWLPSSVLNGTGDSR
ncbi:MAG: PhnD/SsuA/transferrin family substrate-binding protein [Halothiobacillaceae bacterium]|nr:PhnD/SsuA/transferrin family substrate-binding protein [Halothiobacillaceae bacterium]